MRTPALLAVLLFAAAGPAQEPDREPERARVVYLRAVRIEKGGSAEAALKVYNDWRGGAGDAIPASVMERMYEAAGGGEKAFKTVALLIDKGLAPEDVADKSLKTLQIRNEHSVQMAEIRERYIEDIIGEILGEKKGEWKVARSDSGNTSSGMKSDLDQTFYVFKKGPYGQWVRDPEADKVFIELFESKWRRKHKVLSLAALDVASIQGKNRFPDPRDVWLDFETKFLSTIDALRRTPGAYTYGGAVAQQMQFRALDAILSGNPRSFQQYDENGKLPFDPDAAVRHMFGLHPELQPAHAYGAALANFLELVKYMKKPKFESKYHLRTWEDGGLVDALDDKLKDARFEYMDLDAEGREKWNAAVIDDLFSDPEARRLHRLAMDASADLRLVHKGKLDRVFPDGDPGTGAGRDAVVFDKLARAMFGDAVKGDPTPGQIKAAARRHRELAAEFCLETAFKAAEEAFKVMNDPRFKDPLNVEGFKHLMTGVKPADWPRVKRNVRTAARISFLYGLYDLGWWKSAQLLGRLRRQFPELSGRTLLSLWVRGRAQEALAPLRNPELRPKLPELKLTVDPEAAKAYARYLKSDVLPDLNRRVQTRILTEIGFANVEKAKAVRGLLRVHPRTWSPARFARNMVWDPGSIDALAQIVRAYVTSKGDIEHTKAVIADEIVLAVPVAGQLVAASRGGLQGVVLMAGAIQFPVVGIGLLVVSIGQAGYAVYDAEYAEHARDNVLDALYRGFAGPATRAYDDAPPQFTKNDAHVLKVLATRLEREKTDELRKRVAALRVKKQRWADFRDGSWAGGYFTEWGAVKERKHIRNPLLAAIPPIVSYSPAGLVDFRVDYDPERDGPRLEKLREEVARGPSAPDFLEKEAELHELEYRKGRWERAQRYLRHALGKRGGAALTEREKRSGVPELLYKFRRDSVYPALLEWARRRKGEVGNRAQANPDRYVEWWLERRGAVAAGECKRRGLAVASRDDIPVDALKDRLTKDFLRSKALYGQMKKLEELRRAQAKERLHQRRQAYDAEAAGLYVSNLDDEPGAEARREFAAALRVAAVRRRAPEVKATVYLVGDRLEARVRVKVDPNLYRGPYTTQVHQLKLDEAKRALAAGNVEGVPLLAREALAEAVHEGEAQDGSARRSSPGAEAGDALEPVIPVVSVFAKERADVSGALRGTVDALPAHRTPHGWLVGQVVPDGTPAAAEEAPEEERGRDHADVHDRGDVERHPPAVVLGVHGDQRRDDEVGVDEAHDPGEEDAVRVQDRGEGDVAHAPDEGGRRDEGRDQRVLDDDQPLRELALHLQEEDRSPPRRGDQHRDEARHGEADQDLLPHHLPLGDEVVADPPPPLRAPDARLPVEVVLLGWGGFLDAFPGRLQPGLRVGQADERGADDDHHDPAHDLGRDELPSEEDEDQDAQLDDEVRRREHEGHAGDEVGALQDQRAGRREGGEGARRRDRAEGRREGHRRHAGVSHVPGQSGLRHEGLDHRADEVAEDEGPPGLPEEAEGGPGAVAECRQEVGHRLRARLPRRRGGGNPVDPGAR